MSPLRTLRFGADGLPTLYSNNTSRRPTIPTPAALRLTSWHDAASSLLAMLDGPGTLCHRRPGAGTAERGQVNAGKLGPHARQTRPDHGGRQPSLARLGHRQGLPRAWRRARFHLSGRRAEEARRAAGPGGRRHRGRRLRRHRAGDHRRGVRGGSIGLGRDRFSGPRHRVLRQGSARRALRRHHGRQFHQDHADQLLLVHRDRPARREADAEWRLDADADLLRVGKMDAALQRHGRRQIRARSLGAVSRRRSRREEHPRQRHLVGPDQDARRVRHRRLPLHPEMERVQRAAAPQRHYRGGRARPALICFPTCRAASPARCITSMPAITSSA